MAQWITQWCVGSYVDNEIIELYILETSNMDELLTTVNFDDGEVMTVKKEHYSLLEQKLLAAEPTYVFKDIRAADGSKGPYSPLFDYFRSHYPLSLDH